MKELTDRQKQALITKGKVYESACKLFAKHDYEKVTIQDICQDANVAVGVFYHYFSSKSAILDEFFGFFYEQLLTKTKQFKDDTPLEIIRNIIRSGCQIHQKMGRTFVSMILRYELTQANYYDKAPRNTYSLLCEAVSKAIKYKILFGDSKLIASDIQKAFRGTAFEWIVRNDNSYILEDEAIRTLNIILFHYMQETD